MRNLYSFEELDNLANNYVSLIGMRICFDVSDIADQYNSFHCGNGSDGEFCQFDENMVIIEHADC